MSTPSVVVVGAVNVDLVVTAPRLPRPGETVVGPAVGRHGGGKGANAAVAAARAGAHVRYVGAVGDDDFGRDALAELRAEGIGVADVAVRPGVATGVALIVVDESGENQIAVGAGANDRVTAGDVRAAIEAALPDLGCVLVSTEIPAAAVRAAVEIAAGEGIPCVLNPAPVTPVVADLLKYGPLLTPNAGELATLSEAVRNERPLGADVQVQARGLSEHTGAAVVVTLGGDGVLVVAPDSATEHLPPRPATVRDTTGAGDTFNGVLAARLAAGEALVPAVRVANAAAALSVAAVGARDGMPDEPAIRAALDSV
ncbi:PfkB family carbohydrate kinase [Amycolatopsis acidiphila]|uniref:Ribokinase n=1 Tax=Amycolatopsis acidiphila TaxID=715473 RepID=A0A558AL73_9PSEU|nr:PfkB family carbohydrate kinase [Amycolatopsis acidiphila]TVT24961.1 ribokinase [Amycolatopsis acidiphila]UIJ57538.1 PfkB family carbohydrate kinase [Amycolatopsis acidiphila]GHG89353.1 ribokinase [Amycolatopsis acidiphila]